MLLTGYHFTPDLSTSTRVRKKRGRGGEEDEDEEDDEGEEDREEKKEEKEEEEEETQFCFVICSTSQQNVQGEDLRRRL